MNQDAAETIALQALGYIAADPESLEGLMASTGIGPDSLKSAATEPGVLTGVLVGILDYLLLSDERTLAFCEFLDIQPTLPGRAWSVLTGRDLS
jgi:hypothetical protein